MKKKVRYISIACLAAALFLCVAWLGSVLVNMKSKTAFAENGTTSSGSSSNSVENEGVIRPESIDEGLSLNSLDDIRGRRVTVRQPVMEILKDDIPRKEPAVLDNTYEMLSFKDGQKMHDLAKIDFSKNEKGEALEIGNEDRPMYPMKGLKRSDKNAEGQVETQRYFSNFKKYMLLRQAWYFNTHATEIINEGKLKKHPAADFIYGKIDIDKPAVRMRIVTDPIYRSPMTTGLYLAPGEVATVTIKNLKPGETISFYTHHQDTMGYQGYSETGSGFGNMQQYIDYWDKFIVEEAEKAAKNNTQPNFEQFSYGIHGQWQWQNQKVPCMGTTFTFTGPEKGEEGADTDTMVVKIGSMYGGPLYIKPTASPIEMEIEGAVLTPHFVLGVTTVEEFEKELRNAPGLIATMDVENGQLIGPAESMRNADDIEKLAYFWHSVFAIDISLNGREYNYNMTMCYDMHVPAGEAVALNSNFCAQPEYWFPVCMNYETLTTKGNWGTFHELGHVQAKTHGVNWGFCDGDGEVWNNTLILIIYSMLCNMDSRLTYVEHGEYVYPYTALERSLYANREQYYKDKTTGLDNRVDDYGEFNEGSNAHFDQLSMYSTLLHSFGPSKFVDMFYTYKLNPAYCPNKRADFVYRIALVDRVNILTWVNEGYFANIKNSDFTASQREFLSSLPTYYPIAYRWANGTDGVETARRYEVDGKHETVFDLSGNNIISPKPFEIVSVTGAMHGTATYNETEKKVTYQPPKAVTEYDGFDIIVRTYSGRQVTLNVRFKLLYRGVHTEVWNLGTRDNPLLHTVSPTIEVAQQHSKTTQPTSTETGSVAGKGEFNHSDLEYFRSTFKFRATKAGEHTFYVRADDQATVNFYQNSHTATDTPTRHIVSKGQYEYSLADANRMWTVELSKDEVVYIEADLVNWGGRGYVNIGLKMPGETYTTYKDVKSIPVENLIGPNVTSEELAVADSFKGWQPQFVDSIKNATIDDRYDNKGWEVLCAPKEHNGCPASNMVDGNEETIYHSNYASGSLPTPHVFVIDTGSEQTFNFFDIIRRASANAVLYEYELYGCTEEEYKLTDDYTNEASDHKNTNGWQELFKGKSSNINAAQQRISFDRTTLRYFKLIINRNGAHTVIREVYAGTATQLNQTVRPTNYMTEEGEITEKQEDGFVENSANGKLSTKKENATFTFQFLGTGFELFADTDENFGSATVTVDGYSKGTIDLQGPFTFNKQVFYCEGLDIGYHNVVITVEKAPFNISFINVQYGTPVAEDEKPADGDNWGENYETTPLQFTRDWRTYVKDYRELTSIQFLHAVPEGYSDTYVRIDTYIRLYRNEKKIAFVYPGTILSPIECGSLFSSCENLEEIVFENFDTTNMRGASGMFYGCKALASIDVSSFTTENVLSFGKMFGDCESLETLDMSKFKFDENANIHQMFENCLVLNEIQLPDEIASPVVRAFSLEETEDITCELPYVYQVDDTDQYIISLTLNDFMAGKTLHLHAEHSFDSNCYHDRVDPQCEVTGTLAYRECKTCGYDFNQNGEARGTELYRELTIPATGHNYTYDDPDSLNDYPTCTKPGSPVRHYCKNCNQDYPGEEMVAMPASGHTYMLDEDYGDGRGYTIEYIKEERTVYTDVYGESGEFEYTKEEHIVRGFARVTFYLKCQSFSDWELFTECGHTATVVLEFDCENYSEATCTDNETFIFHFSIDEATLVQAMIAQDTQDEIEDGLYNYGGFNVNTVEEGGEVQNGVDALGHQEETIEAVAPTCEGYGSSAGIKCSVCGHMIKAVQKVEPEGHKWAKKPALAATCTEAGHGEGTVCSVCGKEGEGVQHIEPLGHDFTIDVPAIAPTCVDLGFTAAKKCSRCGVIEGQNTVHDLGHEHQTIPGKAPTETESGLTDGIICPRCGEILQAQEVIPALGIDPPALDDGAVSDGKSLSVGAIVGISAGGAAVLAGGGLGIFFFLRRKRRLL